MKRFFLDQDQDSHWYLIPVARREAWDAWCELSTDDEASWTAPKFAQELGCHPNTVTFSQPETL
jgi:hypothetical protein